MSILSKKTRKVLIIILSVLATGLLVSAAMVYAFPGRLSSKETTVRGESTAEINFSVLMDENPVYENNVVSDEKYYLKPFTGYLDIECNLNISANNEAEIECSNEVYGLLISEITTEDGKDRVWEKRYNYSGQQVKKGEGRELNVNREVYISLDEYEELASMLMDDYNLLTDYYLRIVFENEITIIKDDKSETELVTTYIDVPFTDNVMEITNHSPTTSEILIQETISKKREPNTDLVFLFVALFIASLISLFIIIFRTKGVDKQDLFKNEVEKIFKEYGNRMAGLTDTLSYQSSVMISIDKIEDIVKIADEIGQTIFYYEVDEIDERKIEFYVFDDGRIYYNVIFGTLKQEIIY